MDRGGEIVDQENKERNEQELMSIVSYLYYYADMNQSDIASRLFLSRSTISRLLKKARASGVVDLKINEPWQRNLALEDSLKTRFSVESVRVLKVQDHWTKEDILTTLGKMTFFYINCLVEENTVLGISWGNTISHVVDSFDSNSNIPFTVVPIMGNKIWPSVKSESLEISYRFSRIYGARYLSLDAPLYAKTREQYQELMQKPDNAEALSYARKADKILTSVGSIENRSWEDVLGPQKLARLQELGCVGHVGGHFFDINGYEIEGTYKELLIGLTLEEIRNVRDVVCVAASSTKAKAVYGAIRANLLDALFITQPLAEQLLEIADQRRL